MPHCHTCCHQGAWSYTDIRYSHPQQNRQDSEPKDNDSKSGKDTSSKLWLKEMPNDKCCKDLGKTTFFKPQLTFDKLRRKLRARGWTVDQSGYRNALVWKCCRKRGLFLILMSGWSSGGAGMRYVPNVPRNKKQRDMSVSKMLSNFDWSCCPSWKSRDRRGASHSWEILRKLGASSNKMCHCLSLISSCQDF